MLKTNNSLFFILHSSLKILPLHSLIKNGQSCTASSLGIPQDGNIARVLGCSGAMQIAAHPPL